MDEVTVDYIEKCRLKMVDELNNRLMTHKLTDEQIDKIAEKAADKAVAKITDMAYREVGKSVVSKLFYVTGVLSVAAYLYAQAHGWIK
jgi:signal-transduction protein with cAMP-binding, CBS, and nucleotidyltransferase domain